MAGRAGANRRGTAARRGAPPLRANVAELRALAHPLRLRLVELFAEAPRTTKQVADLLGEPPTRLYHHVNALERAGLLRLRETRPNRGAVEKWYEAAPHWSSAATRGGSGAPDAAATPTTGLALTLLEQARHELTSALADPATELPLLVRIVAVGAAKRGEVRRKLNALVEELRRASTARAAAPTDAEERWSLTIAFAPVRPPADAAKGAPRRGRKSR